MISSIFSINREEWKDPSSPEGQLQAVQVGQEEKDGPNHGHLRAILEVEEASRRSAEEYHGAEGLTYGWKHPTDLVDRRKRSTNHGSAAIEEGCQNEQQVRNELCYLILII